MLIRVEISNGNDYLKSVFSSINPCHSLVLYFIDHETAFFICYFYATIQLFVAIQRNFPGQFFSEQVTGNGNSPEIF